MKYKSYKKDFEYSYTFGLYPTIELLKNQDKKVIEIIYSEEALKSSGFEKLVDLCNVIPISMNNKQISKVADKGNTYVVGIFEKYQMTLVPGFDHLLLYNPSDEGNLGTICRSAVGFGRPNIGIIDGSIDVFSPKVIRASMGAIFSSNIQKFATLEEYRMSFSKNKIYSFDTKGQTILKGINLIQPNSFLFGNEGAGLPKTILDSTETVKIEFKSEKIDSLNLGTSVGIALYEAC